MVSIDLPDDIESTVKAFAASAHLSTEDAILRLIEAGLKHESRVIAGEESNPRPSYASMFGAAKTGEAYRSPEAVDRYIAELRNEW
ncbi:MAG: hypothetical protein ACO1SV_17870 [Fimbriimonas sp.]